MADWIASTSFVVHGDPEDTMEQAEAFLISMGASIEKRTPTKIKASLKHPDGFDAEVAVTYYQGDGEDKLEITRVTGDCILFSIVFRTMSRSFLDGAEPTPLFEGQMLPRLIPTFSAPPFTTLPHFRLDDEE